MDTAFGFTSLFKSDPPRNLKNIGLFILLVIWPAVATLIYFGIMSFIVLRVLGEKWPFRTYQKAFGTTAETSLSTVYYFGSLILFAGSQLVFLFLGVPICQVCDEAQHRGDLLTLSRAPIGLWTAHSSLHCFKLHPWASCSWPGGP
jgi:hypothetical protein